MIIMNKVTLNLLVLLSGIFLLTSCASIPRNAEPIQDFNFENYLGVWYELARFDFRYEKDLDNTSAQYTLGKDGAVLVLNSGYNTITGEWQKADGKAKLRGEESVAALKVSFFGPFYSGYNVLALDEDYRYALIAGKSLDYLWILSREKEIPTEIKDDYLKIATEVGYDLDRLIWVKQDRDDNPYLNEN